MNMSDWWVSVDGAKRVSGVAIWRGSALVMTCVIKGLGWENWRPILLGRAGIVIEDGFVGKNRNTAQVLATARGKITAYAEVQGAKLLGVYHPSTWRRHVGIPATTRKAQKKAAFAMCRWLSTPPAKRPPADFGSVWAGVYLPILANDPSEDECEAALLGLAHLRKQGDLP